MFVTVANLVPKWILRTCLDLHKTMDENRKQLTKRGEEVVARLERRGRDGGAGWRELKKEKKRKEEEVNLGGEKMVK